MDIYLVNTVSAQATFIATGNDSHVLTRSHDPVSVSANLFVSASISFPAGYVPSTPLLGLLTNNVGAIS